MPRTLTKDEKHAREDHFAEHPNCWMCLFLGRQQQGKTELHHIASRGKHHEVRQNFAALCSHCHRAIQSRFEAELACLVLKKEYDPDFYSPSTICLLRGRAPTCWTASDVHYCLNTMRIMREVMR